MSSKPFREVRLTLATLFGSVSPRRIALLSGFLIVLMSGLAVPAPLADSEHPPAMRGAAEAREESGPDQTSWLSQVKKQMYPSPKADAFSMTIR